MDADRVVDAVVSQRQADPDVAREIDARSGLLVGVDPAWLAGSSASPVQPSDLSLTHASARLASKSLSTLFESKYASASSRAARAWRSGAPATSSTAQRAS